MNPHQVSRGPKTSRETAEKIAIAALNFLSQDIESMGRFLALTGLAPSDLRQVAKEPSFLGAILDFMLQDDALVLAFASNNNLDPQEIVMAQAQLNPIENTL